MRRFVGQLMVFACTSGACSARGTAPVPAQPGTSPDIVCELQLSASPPYYSVSFVLSNRTTREKTLRSFAPFLDFKLQVTAAGSTLRADPSEYSADQHRTVIRLPPHGSVTVRSPVRLIFGTEVHAGGFSWTIFGTPPVDVTATLNIEGEHIAPCAASIPAASGTEP